MAGTRRKRFGFWCDIIVIHVGKSRIPPFPSQFSGFFYPSFVVVFVRLYETANKSIYSHTKFCSDLTKGFAVEIPTLTHIYNSRQVWFPERVSVCWFLCCKKTKKLISLFITYLLSCRRRMTTPTSRILSWHRRSKRFRKKLRVRNVKKFWLSPEVSSGAQPQSARENANVENNLMSLNQ